MLSLDSVEKALETRCQLTEMGDKAGFHVRKWILNLTEVLVDVPEEDHEFPVTKMLGMSCIARDDQFLFHYSPPVKDFKYTIKAECPEENGNVFRSAWISFPFHN